jgi:hypothetical protein
MFIVLLFTIANLWNQQSKCSTTDEWIKKKLYTHTPHRILLSHEEKWSYAFFWEMGGTGDYIE